MEVNEVKQHILANKFDSFYIFTGEEREVAKTYMNMMAQQTGNKLVFADSIIDVLSKPKMKSFVPQHYIYVIMDDKDFLTNEKAWTAINKAIKDDIVIFWYEKADQRLKFWKKFKDRAVSFDKLDKRILTKHIKQQIALSDSNCEELIDICEGNYGRILLEIDKIHYYIQSAEENLYDLTPNEAFYDLVKDGTIYCPAKDAIFDFVNAVLDRDVDEAYYLLRESEECGESNMVLISVLYNNFRNLLIYQTNPNGNSLSGWEKKNIAFAKNNYSNGELIHALRILRKCEFGIKRGLMPEDISVHYALVNII